MLKYVLIFIVFIHGLIHLMGFAKAYGYGDISQLTQDISRPAGMVWLITAFLLIAAAAALALEKQSWWLIALAGAILSQVLILTVWQDARFGTIANVIILAAIGLGFFR